MDFIGKQMNVNKMEDWYNVSTTVINKRNFLFFLNNNLQDIINNGGRYLIKKFPSMLNLLSSVYPEYNWEIFRFQRLPNNFKQKLMRDANLQEKFVKFLEKEFEISKTSDWNSVNFKKLRNITSTMKFSEILNIIKKFYPDLNLSNFNVDRDQHIEKIGKNPVKVTHF